MAVTDNQTARDINNLLVWLLPQLRRNHGPDGRAPARADAMAAAERLATKASNQIGCGVTASAVRAAVDIDSWRFEAIDNGDRDSW
ncbi:hypothetical protein [Stenotrophomonas sp. PS02298]|uniref:hypothetical protein n=1 Tax=Stenotrophomonas sp. PS02298 TaxID=2991424 RepID=UPI00249CF236|nr:hypothetical protein [Stenotrophomonas sp. PS02298]